jgi:hypothetical protein
VGDKADSIEAGRRLINNSWFCSEYAGDLVECLDNYTRAWNKTTMQWMAHAGQERFRPRRGRLGSKSPWECSPILCIVGNKSAASAKDPIGRNEQA